jgi:signal transduction histidine kinase
LFYQTAIEILEANEAIELLDATLPVFTWANEFVARQELQTDRLRVSQELEQTRRYLERLEKSKSDFISIAAHELKTPLTLIEGYAEMLNELQNGANELDQPRLMLKGIQTGTLRSERSSKI